MFRSLVHHEGSGAFLVHQLSIACNQVFATAAVVGRQFNLDLLEVLIGDFSEERLLEMIDEAITKWSILHGN